MLRIVVDVDAPVYAAQGVKESLAMYLERWGDAAVRSVTETRVRQEQTQMDEWRQLNAAYGVRP